MEPIHDEAVDRRLDCASRESKDTVLVTIHHADGRVETRFMSPQRVENIQAADAVLRKIDALQKVKKPARRKSWLRRQFAK